MEIIDRDTILEYLEIKWPAFVRDALALPDGQRAAWLHKQGYSRATDLLAHVAAWWSLGMDVITHHRADTDYQHGSMNVDAFNLEAVTRVSGLSEADVLADFNHARDTLVAFVNGLSDAEIANPKINRQLYIEVIDHYHEHKI